jgi:phosphate/sulfate permease
LRKGTDAATARERNARLQSIEGDADKLELELLKDLYVGDYDAKEIIFLRDLYNLLEKVIDRCRDAGNIILQVVLKYPARSAAASGAENFRQSAAGERGLDGAQPRPERRPKTMGIITLALFTGTQSGVFNDVGPTFAFLQTPSFVVPKWVIILCAVTMAAGTAAGGWRIIRTLGHKMVKLQPVHGFAAETTAAVIIDAASSAGIPLSTTHVITTSIMGGGAAKRFSGVRCGVVERILWAWVFTLPATGLIGYICARLARGLAL